MTQRLTFLNLLVEQGEWVLQVRGLLVKRGHSEFLVDKSLVLSA